MNWLNQVVPPMDPFGGTSGELYSLREVEGSRLKTKGMRTNYMGIYDVLREVSDSYFEYEI